MNIKKTNPKPKPAKKSLSSPKSKPKSKPKPKPKTTKKSLSLPKPKPAKPLTITGMFIQKHTFNQFCNCTLCIKNNFGLICKKMPCNKC